MVVSLVLSVLVLALAGGNLLPAGTNTATLVAASVWGWIGPHLVVVALVAFAISLPAVVRWRTWRTVLVASMSVVAIAASATIVGSITLAANAAGGAVDPVSALVLAGGTPGPDRDVVFEVVEGQELHSLVYEPDLVSDAPVLLYIHGGGWVGGDASEGVTMASEYAKRGWLAMSVDYRIATPQQDAWAAAPADVGCALTWAAGYAAELGADPRRIVVMGDSAGGNLALNLGWSAAVGQAASSCPELGKVPVPQAVVASYPVANPQYAYDEGRTWFFDQTPNDFTDTYLGGTPSEFPERMHGISPSTYASVSSPPTLIVQPERDDFVPAAGNYELVKAARGAGVDITLVKIPFTHHAFDILPGSLGFQAKHTTAQAWLAASGLAP